VAGLHDEFAARVVSTVSLSSSVGLSELLVVARKISRSARQLEHRKTAGKFGPAPGFRPNDVILKTQDYTRLDSKMDCIFIYFFCTTETGIDRTNDLLIAYNELVTPVGLL